MTWMGGSGPAASGVGAPGADVVFAPERRHSASRRTWDSGSGAVFCFPPILAVRHPFASSVRKTHFRVVAPAPLGERYFAEPPQLSSSAPSNEERRLSNYICIMSVGIMLWFMLAMIHSEPMMISPTISTPKASASTLL